MQRREFLRTTCSYCFLAGTGFLLSSLESCASVPVMDTQVVDKKISIPLSAFTSSDTQILQPRGLLYDIALHKEADGNFKALVLICTHASNQLTPTGSGYSCPAHGSTFDAEGRVTRGPAQLPLRELPIERTLDAVIIHVS